MSSVASYWFSNPVSVFVWTVWSHHVPLQTTKCGPKKMFFSFTRFWRETNSAALFILTPKVIVLELVLTVRPACGNLQSHILEWIWRKESALLPRLHWGSIASSDHVAVYGSSEVNLAWSAVFLRISFFELLIGSIFT